LIEPEVAAQLESASSVIVGSVDPSGAPLAAHAYGAQVLASEDRIRVVLNAAEEHLLANLRATGVAAVAVTEVPTLRSIQVKGRVVAVEPATVADRQRSDAWRAGFFAAVHEVDGTPFELLERLAAREYACVEVAVEELYDQTPGPHAGSSLPGPGGV
jgi:hypothetical protein